MHITEKHIDSRHGRRIATGRTLAPILRKIFARMKLEARVALRAGRVPDLRRWIPVIVENVTPLYQRWHIDGAREAVRRLSRLKRGRRRAPIKSYRTTSTKAMADLWAFDWNLFNFNILDAVKSAVFDFAASTIATLNADIETAWRVELGETIGMGLESGETLKQITERVGGIFDDPFRAFRIAATEASRAQHGGQLAAAVESGVVTGKEWLLSDDACELCQKIRREKPIADLDEPFYINPKGGPYAVVMYPPAHPFCVVPGTKVFAPGIKKVISGEYSGSVVTVNFFGGDSFTITPNHMLLTSNGFIKASSLVSGDDVIYCPLENATRGNPHHNREPSLIDDVVHAFSVASGGTSILVEPSPEYLHGDAAFFNSEVNIVDVDGFLRRHLHEGRHHRREFDFGFGLDAVRFGCDSDLAFLFKCLLAATDGRVGVSRDRFSVFSSGIRKADRLRFTERSRLKSVLSYNPAYDATRHSKMFGDMVFDSSGFEHSDNIIDYSDVGQRSHFSTTSELLDMPVQPFLDGVSADTHRLGQLLERFSGFVTTRKVRDIGTSIHNGPVYDLETESTMYVLGNGAISSNCMCAMIERID